MAAKLKIEKRGDAILIVHCCYSISQNEQIPFHQSLVAIVPVVSEEKIKVYDVRQRTTDAK
jgi:hypothetical protein